MADVSALIARVARELIDDGFVRWSKETHIDNLNDAISAVLIVRPDLARVTKEQDLTAGQYKVELPNDAYKLLEVNHVGGHSLSFIDIKKLNGTHPDWRSKKSSISDRWTRNKNDEDKFFIYPAPNSDTTIEYDYCQKRSISAETDEFPLDDIYQVMVFEYMVYRAYSKDGQDSTELSKANSHYQAFTLLLTGKAQGDMSENAPPKEAPRH